MFTTTVFRPFLPCGLNYEYRAVCSFLGVLINEFGKRTLEPSRKKYACICHILV